MMKTFKTLLLTALALWTFMPLSAQVVREINWGYADNTVASGIGTGSVSEVSGAIYIPVEVSELYKGKDMKGLRIGLKQEVSNLTIFVKKNLEGESIASATFESASAGTAFYKFSTAFVPDGEGFYVGYTCTGLDPIGCSGVYNANGCWINKGGEGWKNLANDEDYSYNALNIAMRFEGSGLPFDVRIMKVDDIISKPGTPFTIVGTVENLSAKAVRNYQISYSIDGGEAKTADFSTYIGFGNSEKFSIPVDEAVENGVHTVKCVLTSVNKGNDDYSGNNTAEAKLNVTDRTFARRMVVEEGTGTWCQWCPQGTVALKEMYEKYPDTFIGIAVHCKDEMSESTYDPLRVNYFTGYPTCIINRDPSTVHIPTINVLEMAYKNLNSGLAIAGVETKGVLDKNNSNIVKAEATVEFMDDQKNANYRVAFVILEDGITGYKQANGYSGSSTPMGGWEKLPSWASVDFDHVARGIYDYEGIKGSLPSELSSTEKYTFSKDIDLPMVQKKTNLHLVALLIDANTGLIMNAAKSKITDGTSGITDIEADVVDFFVRGGKIGCDDADARIEVYEISGTKVANCNLRKGTYIVRLVSSAGNIVVSKITL